MFLDEPTAGIDPILRARFWERFRELRDDGRTMIVTTQYVGEAVYCDLVGVLSDGELILLDTPEPAAHGLGGDVLDLELATPVPELDGVAALGCVLAPPREHGRGTWRIVVDAATAIGPVRDAITASGAESSPRTDHAVDYDEAFVHIIERHRLAETSGSP